MDEDLPSIGIVGWGRVGQALGRALAAAGYPLAGICTRTPPDAPPPAPLLSAAELLGRASLLILAVPDDALAPLARELAAIAPPGAGAAALHCSGALSLEPLAPLAAAGWRTGGLHPLQSFATRSAAVLPGITWGVEAAEPLRATLDALVGRLGGQALHLRAGDKTLYHAAAVIACNYAITLAQVAVDLLGACGIAPEPALAALLPLLAGNQATLAQVGLPAALTGPLARGDSQTVLRHLQALDQRSPAVADLYRALAAATLPLLAARSLPAAQIAVLRQTIAKPESDH